MLYNLTLCKACLQRLVTTNKFVRLKSHYAVLGVSNSATQKDIRDAYIKLSKKLHPDQNRHDTKSHEKFVQINEAYEVLSKDSSRRNYDDTLRVRNQPGKDFGTYGTSHRPPNYYSSGQFYEDQGYYYNHYNPYSKRNQQSNYDPFSSYGYEQHQRQRSRVRPRYTSNSDRKAHEEKLTLQLQLYAALICILAGFTIFFNILNEDRSLVLRQQDQAENEEAVENDDRVVVAFHRVWWTMAILMAVFMLWEVIIHAHIKVTSHGLMYDDSPRRRIFPEDTGAYIRVLALIILVSLSTLKNYEHRNRKEAEAWEKGSANKSKMLIYLGIYASIVLILSKQEIERRKQSKEKKLSEKSKMYSKPTAGRESS